MTNAFEIIPNLILSSSFSFLIDDTINLRRIKYEQIEIDVEKEKLI